MERWKEGERDEEEVELGKRLRQCKKHKDLRNKSSKLNNKISRWSVPSRTTHKHVLI